jgi:hypothetical protein
MECLGIPVDYQLRSLICKTLPPGISKTTGAHIQILCEFGDRPSWRDREPICMNELNFGLDLAGPETTGGILVLLQQPSKTLAYRNGFTANVQNCRTLDAIRQLVTLVSNHHLTGLDDVSVFDMLPFMAKHYKNPNAIRDAHEVLVYMLKAKVPEIVVCCSQGTSHHPFGRELSGLGVGGDVFLSETSERDIGVPLRECVSSELYSQLLSELQLFPSVARLGVCAGF